MASGPCPALCSAGARGPGRIACPQRKLSFALLDVRRLRVLRSSPRAGRSRRPPRRSRFTPPAISQQLATLEREVGVALLERDGRSVRLTDAARTLVAHTETVLAQLEVAEADLAGLARRGRRAAARRRVPDRGQDVRGARRSPRCGATTRRSSSPSTTSSPPTAWPRCGSPSSTSRSCTSTRSRPRTRHPGLVLHRLAEDPLHVAVPAGDPLARARRDPALRPRRRDLDRRPRGHRVPRHRHPRRPRRGLRARDRRPHQRLHARLRAGRRRPRRLAHPRHRGRARPPRGAHAAARRARR